MSAARSIGLEFGSRQSASLPAVDDPFAPAQRCQAVLERLGVGQRRVLAEELQLAGPMRLQQRFEEASPEQTRQHLHRQEEPRPARHPGPAVRRRQRHIAIGCTATLQPGWRCAPCRHIAVDGRSTLRSRPMLRPVNGRRPAESAAAALQTPRFAYVSALRTCGPGLGPVLVRPMTFEIPMPQHVKPFIYESLSSKALHFSISNIQSRTKLTDP